ncbi:MAG: hypothetical protein IMX02_13330 [Limnochordaceae bacterium]|nr:hypothetical protein [Limnochordaceae bacterium]
MDAEGYVQIVDRKKDIIISGGENISSVEVENCIYSHPAVLECAVIAATDPHWGEVPKALVVPKPGQTVTPEELSAYCRDRIAHFKVPRQWVILDRELPKTGTGKVMKAELRKLYGGGQAAAAPA